MECYVCWNVVHAGDSFIDIMGSHIGVLVCRLRRVVAHYSIVVNMPRMLQISCRVLKGVGGSEIMP